MKKLDFLLKRPLKPKAETISFLMQFSKSLAVIETKTSKFLVSKN